MRTISVNIEPQLVPFGSSVKNVEKVMCSGDGLKMGVQKINDIGCHIEKQ